MSASTPMGGRSYPPNAAGTQLANGLVLSGDDADAFRRAGYDVLPVYVRCSARIAAGEQDPPEGSCIIAVERHGASLEDLERWMGAMGGLVPATGIYEGSTARSAAGWIYGPAVASAHRALERELPGFECFAVMTPVDD